MKCTDGQGRKCERTAEYMLHDGNVKIPGGGMCEEHALECLQEYADKLDLHWQGIPIDEYGKRARGKRILRATRKTG